MSYSDPIKVSEVQIDKIDLQFPKEGATKNGNGMFVYPKHNKQKLRIILPTLTAPYGAGPQKDSPKKFSMAIAFDGMENGDKNGRSVKEAYDVLTAIDNRMRELMMEKRELFFKDATKVDGAKKDAKKKGVGLSDELLAIRYKDFIRSRDEQSDIMYLGLQTRKASKKDIEDKKFTADEIAQLEREFVSLPGYPLLIDSEGHPIPVNVDNIKDVIPWNTRIKPVIEFAYLWVTSEKVHPIWTFVHGARKSTGVSKGFNILKDDDDEEEEENRMDTDKDEEETESNEMETEANEEEEEEEEMAP